MVKVLVSGDVFDYSALLIKIKSVHESKNGPFDVCLVTRLAGAVWQSLSGSDASPVPIYALADVIDVPLASRFLSGKPDCIATNVTYLSAHGVGDVAGLRMAWSNGSNGGADAVEQQLKEDGKGADVVDVLLTTLWPADVVSDASASSLPADVTRAASGGSGTLAAVAQRTSPRYHFAGGGDVFFQRAPYVNDGAAGLVTRYISLAAAPSSGQASDGKGERKWMHALALPPAKGMDEAGLATLVEAPAGTTGSPYAAAARKRAAPAPAASAEGEDESGHSAKRARTDGQAGGTGSGMGVTAVTGSSGRAFVPASGLSAERAAQLQAEAAGMSSAGAGGMFWGARGGMRGGHQGPGARGGFNAGRGDRHGGPGRDGRPAGPPPECWFCLASPKVEKHLVVSVGTEAYLALPKGGVSPYHLLVVPIAHHASLASAPASLREEVWTFLSCLAKLFRSKGLVMLAFERVLHREKVAGQGPLLPLHTHMQVTGLPAAAASMAVATFKTEGAFKVPAITFTDVSAGQALLDSVRPEPGQAGHDTCEYLYVEAEQAEGAGSSSSSDLPRTRMVHRVPPGTRHPVQFGREVLCRLLGAPDKIEWKKCVAPQEEEAQATAALRAEFAPYDFTLNL